MVKIVIFQGSDYQPFFTSNPFRLFSLNINYRERQEEDRMRANQQFVRRLSNVKPQYDASALVSSFSDSWLWFFLNWIFALITGQWLQEAQISATALVGNYKGIRHQYRKLSKAPRFSEGEKQFFAFIVLFFKMSLFGFEEDKLPNKLNAKETICKKTLAWETLRLQWRRSCFE